MQKPFFFCVFLLAGLSNAFVEAGEKPGSQETQNPSEEIAKSAERYFSAGRDFLLNDLLVQSKVSDLQEYLKRTQGHSPVTHPRLLKRVLPDHAALSKLFYEKKFKKTLRELAVEFKGYELLYLISRSTSGRKELRALLEAQDIEAIREKVAEIRQKPIKRRREMIFTIKDLVRVAFPPPVEPKEANREANENTQSPETAEKDTAAKE